MQFLTREMRTKRTARGENIIAFSVSDEAFEMFCQKYKNDKEYIVEMNEVFQKTTRTQQNFFYSLLRSLSKNLKWSFDETKEYVLTHEGIEVTTRNNGIDVASIIEVDIDTDIEKLAEDCKKQHLYIRETRGTLDKRRFVLFKGISLMTSQEMWVILERLLRLCEDREIPTITAKEYKALKGAEENQGEIYERENKAIYAKENADSSKR